MEKSISTLSKIKASMAVGAFCFAIVFAFLGLFLPPQGEIDSSVLILVAQLLVLCATFLGIRDFHLPHGPGGVTP